MKPVSKPRDPSISLRPAQDDGNPLLDNFIRPVPVPHAA